MPGTVRVAAVQLCSGTEPDPNLAAIETLVTEAVAGGATYVLTPEVSVVFAENREGLARVAGPWEGNPAITRLSHLARRLGVTLHLGSMAVALPDGRYANRSVVFAPDGGIIATYDKIHLFDASIAGLNEYRESATYRGGDRAMVVPAAGFRLGLTICYDVRFPALHRALAKAGAQVIAVPAAFTVPTGQAHWEVLLRARAIETASFVIAAAQGGQHQNGRATYGHSMIIDPWGKVLARAEGDQPGLVIADLDLAAVGEARARIPVLENAREFSTDRLG
ncbi:MAG: AmiE [Devosia sp.]|nr:AmiE [Devosia sp.]